MSNPGMPFHLPRSLRSTLTLAALSVLASAAAVAQAVSPTSVSFSTMAVNTTSAASVVTFTNKTAAPLTMNSISASAPFQLASTNCPLAPTTLGPGLNCTASVVFMPTETGYETGSLTFAYGSSSFVVVPLSGTASTGGSTQVNPVSLNFGSVLDGATTAAQTVVFTNQTSSSITLGTIAATGDFLKSSTTCGSSLGGGASCKVSVTFTPSTAGTRLGTVQIPDSADASPVEVSLSGNGLAPVSLKPSALAFGNQAVSTTSAAQIVTLTNNTAASVTVNPIGNPGSGFAVSSTTCGSSLGSVASCTISLTFKPGGLGSASAGLSVTTSQSATPLGVSLSGNGIAGATLSPTAVNFGNQAEGFTSPISKVTLTNNTSSALTGLTINMSGAGFALDPSTTCGTSLGGGATCSIALTATAGSLGPLSGSVTVQDAQADNPPVLNLTATGVAPVRLAPASQYFGAVVVNTTGTTKILTLTNNEPSALTISSVNLSGPFTFVAAGASPCPITGGTVPANSTCQIGLAMSPTAKGPLTGQITVNDSATNTPQFTALSGVGLLPVTASPASLNFGNVVLNTTSAAQNITLTNNELSAITGISITVPAPYALASGTTTCGSTLNAGKNCTISVTLTPTAAGPVAASAVSISDSGANSPQTVSLMGNGQPPVKFNPAAVNFGNVVRNVAASQNVTVTNNQSVPVVITSISGFTNGYALGSGTTCPLSPGSVPSGGNCVIQIQLTAPGLGATNGSVTVAMQGLASQNLSLSANAVNPVVLSPGLLYFKAQYLGSTSSAQTVILSNKQAVPLHVSGVSFTGTNSADFAVTSACPSPVPATTSCNLSVTFNPTGTGTRTATLQVADDATGSPQVVQVSGSGSSPLRVSPTSITNYTASVGSTSAYQTVTVTNSNPSQGVTFGAPQVNGDFLLTSTTCPSSPTPLAGGASCAMTIEFNPAIGGTRDGQLIINDSTATSPQVVNLSGIGRNPLTRSTGALVFSAQLVNTSSPAKLVVLTNHESEPETFSLATTGDFSTASNCGSGTIAANSTCNLLVTFTPSSTTPTLRTGTLTVTDSAPGGSPLSVGLSGSATATNPAAAVAVVSPGAGAAGTNVNVVITGNGWTHFSSSSAITFVDTDSSSYPSDITVSAVNAVSPNELDATLTLTGGSGVVYGARNIKVVTPLSGGGNETASLRSAFIIADPSNAHDIVSFTPGFGAQGQTESVDIVATSTNFVQGTTFANFGAGITVNSLTITGPTTATANITISNTTTVGNRIITMMTGGEFATSAPSGGSPVYFQVGPNNAALVSVSTTTPAVTPVSVPQSFAGPIYLTATGTHFLQSATTASISGGVIVGDVLVTSPTTATAQVVVPSNAAPGTYNVTVATGGEIASLNNSFTVTGSTPALVSVSPGSAKQGASATVTITGNSFTAFNACPGGVITADFTGEISNGAVTVVGAHQVTVPITVSQNASVGSITANLTCGSAGSATIFPFTFTVTPSAAQIVSVVPNSVAQGAQVTLNVTGLNTNWVQGTTMSAFYPAGVPVPSVDEVIINSATSAQLAVAVPTSTPPGNYTFWMATGGQIVNATISVYANTPTLIMSPSNGLVPMSGSTNFTVNFTGQFTHWVQGTTLPVIAGQGVVLSNFQVLSPVSATGTITLSSTAATGLRLVTFTTGGEIETTYYNVTSTPVGIYLVAPYRAPQNDTLNVSITGLNTHFVQGTTQVIFGGPQITVNSVTVSSATKLVANITTSYLYNGVTTASPPGWQTLYVNTGAEQVTGGFSIDAPATPTILRVNPTNAAQGSTVDVTITGSLTNWVQGTSNLIMGAGVTVANLQITSPTTATATISVAPTAPIGGNSVIMVTGSEYDGGQGFSVTPSSAYITNVAPNVTCQGVFTTYCGGSGGGGSAPVVSQLQTATLNITGVGTHWLQSDTTLSFGSGVSVDSLTVTSPTTMTAQITVLSTAPVGFATATATTDGEIASMQQAIDIEEGSPKLLAISPGSAQQGATLNLEVLGRFTGWNSTTVASFNQDITVNSVNVVDSETAVLNITVSPLAYVDTGSPCGHVLTITTGSEQVSTAPILDNFCVSQGAEEVTGVSPAAGVQGTTENVTITGSATNFINGVTAVSFGDSNIQVGTVTVTSPTSLTVPIAISTSSATGFKTVTATTYGQVATQQFAFTVSPGVAQLVEGIPNQAEQGVQNLTVKLIGQYSHFSSSSTATFGAGITVVGTPTYVSPTEIDAVINIDPLSYTGGRDVTVTTPNVPCSDQPPADVQVTHVTYAGCTPGNPNGTGSEIVDQYVFSIIPGPAIITGVSPNTGNEGQEVVMTITGANTHWAQNFTQFYIAGGGSDITVNDVVINSATSATVDMTISPTANPGTRSVYMVTAGESLTDSGAFVVTGGVPVITYLSPNSAEIGTNQLEVTINGLYTNWTQATTAQPNFGPGITVTSYTVDDATHISAVINVASDAQLGYRTVIVTTGSQTLTGNFLVTGPPPPPTPYIWYETPTTGIPGQTLTINWDGINTEWNPNPTTGTQLTGWNSAITVNSFQVTSANTATANITISPTATQSTSTLTFTTPGTATYGTEVDATQFTVVVAQPTLSIVDPGSGMQGAQNISVNVLGQFTAFDASTTFSFGGTGSGITVNSVQILGPGIANVTLSIDPLANLGGYSVTAYTPDATNTAQQVVGGAGFSVTPSLATILTVNPNTAPQGTTNFTVNVVGQNTLWDGATTFQFGAGIVVTNANVTDNTHATLTLSIPPLAGEGSTYLQARTAGEIATLNQAFVVTAGTPLLLSSGPGSVEQQGAATFTVLSQATHWLTSPPTVSTVSYGAGITITNVNVTSDTSMTVSASVSATTPVGYRNLTVTTGTQSLSINNAVYVAPGPAVVNSVSPSTGGQSQTLNVTIQGINTNWVQGVTTLSFPDVQINSFTINSPTSATANITVSQYAPAGLVNVTMTTLGEVATKTNAFQITQTQPEMLYIGAPSAMQGQTTTVTITALNTTFGPTTTATFGTGVSVNSVNPTSATQLQVNLTVQPTAALGYRTVTVTTGTQVVSSPSMFSVTAGPAAILSLSPASGGQGTSLSVNITGSQTNFAGGVSTAAFGGGIQVTGFTVTDATHATASITIPNTTADGSYNVTVTTGGEVATILGGFTVTTGSAKIVSVNPATGNQGSTENVTITGQFTNFVNGTSVASFGSGITVNSTTVSSATSAVANITISPTATISSRTVTVKTNSETASITGGFSVLAGVPAISSAAPGSAAAGASANVVINGAFTSFQQNVTTVSFGSGINVTAVTVASATQLTASITVNDNATVGSRDITVTTNSQQETLSNGFSVTPGTPVITEINPNYGNPGQTLSVNIYGQYTNWVNGTTTANFGSSITVNSVTVSSATQLTANITIGATAPVGPVDVTTTTNSEVETVPGGFTIQAATIPAPSVISLSPGPNVGGLPLNTNFTAVFSQPMNRTDITSSTVLLYLTSNQGQGNITVPGTVTVDATGRIATFTPSGQLAPNSTYLFELTNGIYDATGNRFGGQSWYLYTGSSSYTTPPTVIETNPPAASTVGTNVLPAVQFSADMNQSTSAGLVVSTGGNPVTGTYSWNSGANCCWGPGTILTFTPSAPLAAGSTYTVSYASPLTDTAGNAVAGGSFTFKTGSGPDTAQNYTSTTINGQSNVGTNIVPAVQYTKPVNLIEINNSTLLLYDNDTNKYIPGAVSVAPNGLSATFTPEIPLLPNTTYHFHQAWGYYDADANYLNGIDAYFTTGAGADTTPPTVTSVSPANAATGAPLNAQVVVRFSSPINPNNLNVITVTPSGGSAINGSASLASDDVTLTFVPTDGLLPSTTYTVSVSGFTDLIGNTGTAFTSGFTTGTSYAPIVLSTGLNASGQLITTNNTSDAHWTYIATSSLPTSPYYQFSASGTPAPLQTVGSGDTGFYSGWPANGPLSDWININPNSTTGNTMGVYSTTFNIPSSVPSNLCLVGSVGIDDNGELGLNGTAITGNISAIYSMTGLNIPVSTYLVSGTNTLALGWGSTDNSDEAFRLQAVIQSCGASDTPGQLSLTSSTPANNATNVPTSTASISLTFNNPIDPLTVNANTLPVMVNWNSNQEIGGTYSVSGNTVTFTPDSPFPPGTNIWVGACNGPLDTAGDSAGGCYTQLTNFTTGVASTPAGTPFQVVAFTPANNANGVGLNSTVMATFNRSYNPGTINPNNAGSDFALFQGDNQSPWCGSYSRSQDNTTLSFNCGTLPSSSTMTAELNSNLQDWAGDPLTNFSSQFTTNFYDSPSDGSIITSRPGSGSSGVSPNQPLVLFSNLPINSLTANSGLQVAQNNTLITGSVQVVDGGYTMVFTPSSSFTPGALIQWWTTGTLADATYNNPINGASGYFYVASSTASLTPTVQVSSPTAYNSGVAENTIFDIQFNTPLNPSTVNSSNIYLYDNSSGLTLAATYTMPQPNEVRMVPSASLSPNDYIYVRINSGLQSTTSEPAASNSWYEYTGTTSDTTTPTVTSAVPYNGATNVAVNDTPGVIFSKPIDPVSVNSTTFQVLKGSTPLTGYFWFNSTNTRVEFVPYAPLPAGTLLTMKITGVLDLAGHSVTYTSNFTTGPGPDFTAPTILWTSVASNGSIPMNGSITVQFSESMDASTFSSTSNFYLRDMTLNTIIPATLSWSSDQSVGYLVPSSPLAAGRQYYFAVNGGTDLAGNAVSGIGFYIYAEFTSATAAPTVAAFNPIDGTTGLGTNTIVEAEFSAPIDPNTLSGVTLKNGGSTVPTTPVLGSGNTVLQLVPATPLAPGTTYTMTVAGVKDPAGNVVATISNSFTTGGTFDINGPSVVSYDPPYNATVGTNVIPKLVFNKPLNPLTVSNSTFRMYLYDIGQWIPLNVTLSADGLEVTLTPQVPLLPGTQYHYQACCGYQDMDGNNGNGADLYFYTSSGTDTTGPTVSVTPVNGATGIPLNANVLVSTSEPIDVTSWNQNSVQLLNGSTPVPGFLTQNSNQMFTFVPTAGTSSPAGTFLGCFADSGNRVLGFNAYSNNFNTVEGCVAACGSRGYRYAGVQSGSQCFCGSGNYSTYGTSSACTNTCTGNSGETCGGNNANDVYTAQAEATPANLAPSTVYTVSVSGLKDDNGNVMTPSTSSFTTGTAASPPGLSLVSTNIPYNATGVSPTTSLVLTFSQILDPDTVNSSTLEVMNTWNSNEGIAGTYTVNGDQVTFVPLTPFPAGANITVGECGGPGDVLGELFYVGACWQQELMNFTVSTGSPDTTAPTVVSVSPAAGATNVPHDISVSVTFSKSMNPGTGGGNNTELFAGQDPQDIGSVNWSTDHTTMTFNVGALYNGTTYTIVLPAGGLKDMSGNALASTFTSTFATDVNPATGNGSVISTSPGNNASGVPTNSLVTLYLNRQADAATVPGNLTVTVNGAVWAGNAVAAAGGYEIQFTPTTAFPAGAVVQWFFSNIYDVNGDVFNGTSGTFYIAPAVNTATEQPQIVAVSPAYNAGNVPLNAYVDLEYNVPVAASSLAGNVYFTNSLPVTISQPAPNIVRLTPTSALTASTTYAVCANGSVMGTNSVAALSDCYATYFTTGTATDSTSGTITVGPPNSSVNVGTNAYIRFLFSKPVDPTSFQSATINIKTGGNAIPGTWTYNYTNSAIMGANFFPTNPLPPSSSITVAVSGLKDYVGDTFASISKAFTTGPTPDISSASVNYDFSYGQTGISTNATFTCRYTEPMDPSSITPSGTFVYSYSANTQIPFTYTFSPDMMSVTMTPTSALAANSEFNYTCNSAIDLTGNAQSNGGTDVFYTGSGPVSGGPTLLQANPPSNTSGLALNTSTGPWGSTSLGLLFNEAIAPNSLGNLTLTSTAGTVPINAFLEDGNSIVVVQLGEALQPGVTYTYNVTGLTDLNGNAITPVTSTFTTGNTVNWTQPTVTSALPANGATGVVDSGATISVTFSEPMDPVLIDSSHIYLRTHNTSTTVPTTFTISSDYKTITLTPTASLTAATIYDLVTSSPNWYMTDYNGNAYTSTGVISTFTTQ
ncbi:MAG TPA: Ig-like domain-containing protein [Acidobacteriaceae bacterium]